MKGKKLVYNLIKCGVEFYSFLFCFRLGPKIISTAERSHSTPVFSSAAPPHCHLRGALKKTQLISGMSGLFMMLGTYTYTVHIS